MGVQVELIRRVSVEDHAGDRLRALAAVLDEWSTFAEQEQAEGVED